MSSADCCCAMWQSPIQGALRPAIWLPKVRDLHSCHETWIIPETTPEVCLSNLIEAVDRLSESEKMHINKVQSHKNFVQIFSFTQAEWLDVVEIEFQPGRERGTLGKAKSFSTGLFPLMIPFAFLLNMVQSHKNFVQIFSFTQAEWLDVVEIEFQPGRERGTLGKAKSFSTGLFPLMIPFAFLLNMIFFFVPFYDNKYNKLRLERIRSHMKFNIELIKDVP